MADKTFVVVSWRSGLVPVAVVQNTTMEPVVGNVGVMVEEGGTPPPPVYRSRSIMVF